MGVRNSKDFWLLYENVMSLKRFLVFLSSHRFYTASTCGRELTDCGGVKLARIVAAVLGVA